jgi:hypothetical protein
LNPQFFVLGLDKVDDISAEEHLSLSVTIFKPLINSDVRSVVKESRKEVENHFHKFVVTHSHYARISPILE